ncbi:hypothetical protein WA026_011938 [Henosepilachna vigintioctopunctata]|uniref:Nuclear hormone receptor HR96 n=1 Tax=Henosepilachna vigintioctopunctata TaxID=420089 RepID=A0AAW1VDN7_9CUCU
MRNKINNKICGVCGDKALGCNFNAVTCESCKAFFRRNALLAKDFKCPFSDHCEITPITRRFCQKCRLDKCFSIGMCKNLILSEEERKVKRKKILENQSRKLKGFNAFKKGFRKIKKGDYSSHSTDESLQDYGTIEDNSISASSISGNLICTDDKNENGSNVISKEIELISSNDILVTSSSDVSVINMLTKAHKAQMVIDRTFGKTECESTMSRSLIQNENINNINAALEESSESVNISSSVHLSDLTRYVIGDNHMPSMDSNPLESILCEAIKLEFQTFCPIDRNHSKELNDAERAKLNELIVANKVVTAPMDEDVMESIASHTADPQPKLVTDQSLLDIINFTAIVIRRLIKMAKKINAFKNLCQEDQVALLKGGSTEIMILRSAIHYNSNSHTWQIPKQHQTFHINMDVLKLAKNNAYQIIEKFMKAFDNSWGTDENIILIMCAIALFTPDRPKVVHKDVIKLEQNSYYYLLRRYLECTFPGCEAKSTFLKLMQTISELHTFNDEVVNIYLDVNPSQLEPLLIELFDVKP